VTRLNTGIEITKKNFPSAYFDEDITEDNGVKFGLKRLSGYRKKYNKTDQRWIDDPNKKNGCSEAADAFRQWAQAKDAGLITISGRTRMKSKRRGNWRTA